MQNVHSPEAKIVAVLHDILEDTPTTVQDLAASGFRPQIIEAIVALTKMAGENRFQAAQRTRQNPLACEVKLADLNDNMDLSRLPQIHPRDRRRYRQYQKVRAILKDAHHLYQHLATIQCDPDYPEFHFRSLRQNFQYLFNAELDRHHPLGGMEIGLSQEWWILFEDASEYLAFCKRHQYQPDARVFLNKINVTDQYFFDGLFQDPFSQKFFLDLFERCIFFHFQQECS